MTGKTGLVWCLAGGIAILALTGHAVSSTDGNIVDQPAPRQVHDVSALHRAGQTFVTWQDITAPPPDELTLDGLRASRAAIEARQIRYRIYRSTSPIRRLEDAVLVGETGPMSAWNTAAAGRNPPGTTPLARYVIDDGAAPIDAGQGLFVVTSPTAGSAFYTVTASERGAENRDVSPANTTGLPVGETVGRGVPVLQRTLSPRTFVYVDDPRLQYYVRWETPPNTAFDGKPFDYLVAIPPDVADPAPVGIHLHAWGGTMDQGFGWWINAEKGAVLVSSNQDPYDWWTGYHEFLWQRPRRADTWKDGVVRPYTQRRLLSFVDWLATHMSLDPARMFTAGQSMGGSGSIMLAIRHPDRIAAAVSWVGVHVPADSPTFRGSYAQVYGEPEWGIAFEDGTPVWDYYDDVWFLRNHPERSVGFITFANGKNDGAIGWGQAVEFFRALQDTRQPHLFVWGQSGHGQRAVMPGGGQRIVPMDLRSDQSLPAFTRGSLDDDPGDGSPSSGDPAGQANRYLIWDPGSIVDEAGRWAVDIELTDEAVGNDAAVDVTPRRLQRFSAAPGDVVVWTVSRGSTVLQRGEAVVDQWGLVTVPQVRISKDRHRLTLVVR